MDEKILVRPAWMSLLMGVLAIVAVLVLPITPGFISMGGILNLGLALAFSGVGLATGIQGVRLIRTDPETYSGTGLAISGIVLCALELLPMVGLFSCAMCGSALVATSSY